MTDSKQARDLVGVLQEAKQQIDPRLAEMARYGGGGGGGRYGGGYRRGGGGGHRGGMYSRVTSSLASEIANTGSQVAAEAEVVLTPCRLTIVAGED
jgi:ATP-dependent RNA helicase DDX5/DBP2